jgi:predicted nucleic acid-binding Zn finger protein
MILRQKNLTKEKGKVVEFLYIGKNNSVILQKNSFQVIANYPGSNFQVGETIEVIEGKFTKKLVDVECSWDLEYFLKYPNIFKEL